MEQHKCKECNAEFTYRKTLGRHIREVHKLEWNVYLLRHGMSERKVCHCGKVFENTRVPGGKRRGGPKQIHCSSECAQIATNCRIRGITTEQYWHVQRTGCDICGSHECNAGRKIHLDHDHQTGKFRGGLCSNCNTAIGMLKDSPELLRKAIEYLSR